MHACACTACPGLLRCAELLGAAPLHSLCAAQAHQVDVAPDRCGLCVPGIEHPAQDWVCCDTCTAWLHFTCDTRSATGELGEYKDYLGTVEAPPLRSYTCPPCSSKRMRME